MYGHLLFMSAEAVNGRIDCGTQGIPLPPGYTPPPPPPAPPASADGQPARVRRPPPPPSPDRFRGVRIFDISDLSNPKQVAAVQSCRGSHTHSLLIDPKDKDNVYIYISGTGNVRQAEELAECTGGQPEENPNTALFRIDIIKVPLAHPELAKIVSSPRIFTDAQSGAMNGLWKGGNHGEGTQTTSGTDKCHDITIYSALGLAAGACSGNGILLDISNPVNPVRIAAVSDPNYAFWHSANFNNAGTKVLFTDEWGGGGQPRCRATDPMNWGADAIFSLSKGKLTLASYYKMPAPQTEFENCVAHNGSLVPIPGRDILVQAWYQGGVSLVDFSDAAHPFEIAYFDRGPVDGAKRAMGGQWSTYWYNGYIYGSEIARGVDVFKLVPNKYITQNEIDAANQVHFDELNVQNQPKITWPANFVVARAYVDQLTRSNALPANELTALNEAIAKGEPTSSDRKASAQFKSMAETTRQGSGQGEDRHGRGADARAGGDPETEIDGAPLGVAGRSVLGHQAAQGRSASVRARCHCRIVAHDPPYVRLPRCLRCGARLFSFSATSATDTADNGVWLATTKDHHDSLRREFPNMRSIEVLGKGVTGWQVLPVDAPDFEEAALRACERILAADPRIGKVPGARRKARYL